MLGDTYIQTTFKTERIINNKMIITAQIASVSAKSKKLKMTTPFSRPKQWLNARIVSLFITITVYTCTFM